MWRSYRTWPRPSPAVALLATATAAVVLATPARAAPGGPAAPAVTGTGGVPAAVVPVLLVRAVDARGAAASFPVLLASLDAVPRRVQVVQVVGGTARAVVPPGRYRLTATVPDLDGPGDRAGTWVVTADTSVPAPTGTVTLDLRDAHPA